MRTSIDVFDEFRGHVQKLRDKGQLRGSTSDVQDDIEQDTYVKFLKLQRTDSQRAEKIADNRAYVSTMLRNSQCDQYKTREARKGMRKRTVFWDACEAPPDPPTEGEIEVMEKLESQQAELIKKLKAKVRMRIRHAKGITISSKGMWPLICFMSGQPYHGKAVLLTQFVRHFCQPNKRKQYDILSQMKERRSDYGGLSEFHAEFWLPALVDVAATMGLTFAEATALIRKQK